MRRGLAVLSAAVVAGLVPVASGATQSAGATRSTVQVAAAKLPHALQMLSVSVVPRSSTVWALAVHVADQGQGPSHYFALRRRGGTWSSEKINSRDDLGLQQVDAVSPSSIWAVGVRGAHTELPWIEHSTGKGFHHVAVPGLPHGLFNDVSSSSPADVWAVGVRANKHALIVHWNGHRWAMMPTTGLAGDLTFQNVSVSGPDNVWVVAEEGPSLQTLPELFHWNGTTWSVVTLPVKGIVTPISVVTTGPNRVWFVGEDLVNSKKYGTRTLTYAMAWNGTVWKHEPSATPSPTEADLNDVVGVGHDLVAVGLSYSKLGDQRPLVLRLVGGRWKAQSIKAAGKNSGLVDASMSAKGAVAVGDWFAGQPGHLGGSSTASPLIDSRHGSHWVQQNP
jgi:hypothetical protein